MGDYDYGRENGLWGDDGIPYGIDDYEPTYRTRNRSTSNYRKNFNQGEAESYVALMKEYGIGSIVSMNNYITKHDLWGMFGSIRRENTFASGFTSMGISKDAYKEIMSLYKTNDVVRSHLVSQKRV
jgi:hypothetical protein